MKFNTKCVHGGGKSDNTGAISPAIYMSSTFSHPGLGETTGFQYTWSLILLGIVWKIDSWFRRRF